MDEQITPVSNHRLTRFFDNDLRRPTTDREFIFELIEKVEGLEIAKDREHQELEREIKEVKNKEGLDFGDLSVQIRELVRIKDETNPAKAIEDIRENTRFMDEIKSKKIIDKTEDNTRAIDEYRIALKVIIAFVGAVGILIGYFLRIFVK